MQGAMQHGLHGTWQRLGDPPGNMTRRSVRMKTLADYFCAREGDALLFFSNRRIYFGGFLAPLPGRESVAWENWRGASSVTTPPEAPLLTGHFDAAAERVPWLLSFAPRRLEHGEMISIDMDELLEGEAGAHMRALRTFSELNILRLEPLETSWMLSALLGTSGVDLYGLSSAEATETQREIADIATPLSGEELMRVAIAERTSVPIFEGVLECWVADQLTRSTKAAREIFGAEPLSFLTTQQPASPLKPRQYMDVIDLYGYQLKHMGDGLPDTTSRYVIVEMKRGQPTATGPNSAIEQLMKYVDWVAENRVGGDYSRVEAYLIATEFTEHLVGTAHRLRRVSYRKVGRGAQTQEWSSLSLVRLDVGSESMPTRLELVLGPEAG